MNLNIKPLFLVFLLLFYSNVLFSLSRFEDLDKSPIGSYEGQVLLGGSISLGIPSGSLMTAEDNFVKDTTYTFEEQEITKTVVISHINYSASLFAEYMFIDRFGARLTVNRNNVIQRTHFGKNYKNESFPLYQDVAFLIGPTAHYTIRQPWDVVFIPQIGLSLSSFKPAPCADSLFSEFSQNDTFDQNIFIFGAELHGMYYFNNGVFICAGLSYTHMRVEYDSFKRTAPEPITDYNNGGSSVSLGLTRFIVSCGYSLYN